MKISLFSGSALIQSASLPGSTEPSNILFFLTALSPFLALSLAMAAFIAFSAIARASIGCSSRY